MKEQKKAKEIQRNRRRSKRVERVIAVRMGGMRIGILGREDVLHEKFAIECKNRKRFMPEKWLQQIERVVKQRIPIVIVHITGRHYDNDIVLMRFKDFEKIIKKEVNNDSMHQM